MSSQANITLETKSRVTAIVSLGSNLASSFGSSQENISRAIEEVALLAVDGLKVSSIYQTDPVDCATGTPDFFNAAVAFQPLPVFSARRLLGELLRIESQFERKRGKVANQPRTLDLDLICFGNLQVNDDFLVLPHPRAHRRRFVIEAIAEIAPQIVLPGQSVTVQKLLHQLSDHK